jgi:hypothetical protein
MKTICSSLKMFPAMKRIGKLYTYKPTSHMRGRNAYCVLVRQLVEKEPPGRPTRMWEDNII